MKSSLRKVVLVVALVGTLGLVSLSPALSQSPGGKKTTEKASEKAGGIVFEVYKDKNGEFRLRIKSDEGGILAITPKGYKNREDLIKVVEKIQHGAAAGKVVDGTAPK